MGGGGSDIDSPSGLHLSGPFSAFSGEKWLREEQRRENAIFLSLAKYIPSGSIVDRISVGQEMILVRSRKQRDGSSTELDWERGREGCPWVRIELARRLSVNGNVCQEKWREEEGEKLCFREEPAVRWRPRNKLTLCLVSKICQPWPPTSNYFGVCVSLCVGVCEK